MGEINQKQNRCGEASPAPLALWEWRRGMSAVRRSSSGMLRSLCLGSAAALHFFHAKVIPAVRRGASAAERNFLAAAGLLYDSSETGRRPACPRSHRVQMINRQRDFAVTPHLCWLVDRAVRRALTSEGFPYPAEVTVTFVNNSQIRRMNRSYRQIDRVTDVLSFPLLEGGVGGIEKDDFDPETGCVELGDVVISLRRAAEQAAQYGHSLDRETAFLCVHSILHLLGYDHELPEEEREMFARQERILTHMGLTRK